MAAAAAPAAALVPLAEGAEQPAIRVKLKLAPKPRKKRGPMPQKHYTCPHKKCQGKVFVGRACFNKHMKGHTPLPPSQACLGCGYNPSRVTSLRNHCAATKCGPHSLPKSCLPKSGEAKKLWDRLLAGEPPPAAAPVSEQPPPPQQLFLLDAPPPQLLPFMPGCLPPKLPGMTELQHEQLCADHLEEEEKQKALYDAWLTTKGYKQI